MTTYKPYGIKELQEVMQLATAQHLPIFTRHQHQEGVRIDFQNWNKILEVDPVNLTVTAERGVTFGQLEEQVNPYGLHLAAMTEDLREITLGDFFADQLSCLTSQRYPQPRYQVLGMQVLLGNGTVLQVAGKTVKNVTGYDMCRFYLSNRETLAIPLTFTLKLISMEPVQAVLTAPIADEAILMELVRGLRQKKLNLQGCVYWNQAAAKLLPANHPIGQAENQLIMVCGGTVERLQRDLQEICYLAEPMQIDLRLSEQPEDVWSALRGLRSQTIWHDGVKVPALQCHAMLQDLETTQTGCWYHVLQGGMQLMPQQADGMLYRRLCEKAAQLGGCGNWYYQYQYGFAPAGETNVWRQLKEKFDPDDRLNPVECGGGQHGN